MDITEFSKIALNKCEGIDLRYQLVDGKLKFHAEISLGEFKDDNGFVDEATLRTVHLFLAGKCEHISEMVVENLHKLERNIEKKYKWTKLD